MQATRFSVRASAAKATTAPARNTKALNITKSILVDSNGGRAVRNVDDTIWEVIYEPANDSIRVLNKDARLQYAAEVGKDNRISVLLDTATPMAGGPPSFEQLQALLKGGQPATEALNGRLAMLAVLGAAGVELATGRTLLEQAATPAGAAAAGGLALFVTAASLAPVLLGRVLPAAAVPTENDSYPDSQLPYFWTGLAETINGRVAMVALAAVVVEETIRGVPAF